MYQRTVLIVEDEFLIRTVLADTLAGEGYDVVEAGETSLKRSPFLVSARSTPWSLT